MTQSSLVKEIPITELTELRLGNVEDKEAGTGVTALIFEHGARVGCDISGGGPASRETPLTSPVTADNPINAILLSGGSAFGLAASDGAMRYLEEHNIGFDTRIARIPLVCQSCIFDLGYKSATIRPDAAMGYAACADAFAEKKDSNTNINANTNTDTNIDTSTNTDTNINPGGNIGAGCGATVGKLYGMERCMKAGLGIHAVSVGPLKLAAIVVVNALGDVRNPHTGETVAGLRSEDGTSFCNTCEELYKISQPQNLFTGNTTIGAVITNAQFSKAELTKIASMTRNAYGRCIYPVATMADGDSIYAASCGTVTADINMVGTLAAEVMAEAILKAIPKHE